ncbi:MAG: helix-turn-helix domain-containing protein [Verrucomicrobiales bacterium]|nr:helix-turn-helix domain-containing protein [Verrucomicrobiales bacterium]
MKILDPKESIQLTESDRKLAQESAALIEDSEPGTLVVQIGRRRVEMSETLASLIGASLKWAAEGRDLSVVPLDNEIGTQEAADLLGVSRPHLVKLLEEGALPHRKVGVQRRLLAGDVIAYKERERQARKKILAELAAEDERLQLNE